MQSMWPQMFLVKVSSNIQSAVSSVADILAFSLSSSLYHLSPKPSGISAVMQSLVSFINTFVATFARSCIPGYYRKNIHIQRN